MRGRSSAATAALALALVLCQPSAALGDQQVIENATSGTTLVTVQVEGNNIDPDDGELGKKTGNDHDPTVMSFVVPTLIPFKVLPDGEMVGPSSEATYLENRSAFGIYVSEVRVSEAEPFSFVEDATSAQGEDVLSFAVGTADEMVPACRAMDEDGFATSSRSWNMAYAQDGNADRIELVSEGRAARLTQNMRQTEDMGQIVWTVAPGALGE